MCGDQWIFVGKKAIRHWWFREDVTMDTLNVLFYVSMTNVAIFVCAEYLEKQLADCDVLEVACET